MGGKTPGAWVQDETSGVPGGEFRCAGRDANAPWSSVRARARVKDTKQVQTQSVRKCRESRYRNSRIACTQTKPRGSS